MNTLIERMEEKIEWRKEEDEVTGAELEKTMAEERRKAEKRLSF